MSNDSANTDNITLILPNGLKLNLPSELLNYAGDYGDFSDDRSVASLGYDLCGVVLDSGEERKDRFEKISGVIVDEKSAEMLPYASVETKLFGSVDETTAIFSLGCMLAEFCERSPSSSFTLRKILQKATHINFYERYKTFEDFQKDLGDFLKKSPEEVENFNDNADFNGYREEDGISFDSVLFTPYSEINANAGLKKPKRKTASFSRVCSAFAVFAFIFLIAVILKVSLETRYLSDRYVPTLSYYEKD